MDEMPLMVYFK